MQKKEMALQRNKNNKQKADNTRVGSKRVNKSSKDSEKKTNVGRGDKTVKEDSLRTKQYNKRKTNSTKTKTATTNTVPETIRLNKYIANSGVASRREADQLILAGEVKVNGVVVTELGTKILPTDTVQYCGETLKRETFRYVLLNKPKGYITTTDDPQERKTVMLLVDKACKERIYPVGRLDRNTTGLLLFTNDGDLAKKLTHPKHNIRKIYSATLDKNLDYNDLMAIKKGLKLEDGFIKVDDIAYSENSTSKRDVSIVIHSGKNRIIRRIFEHLGYQVVKLDRVSFAGLTKKDLPRGKYRHLSDTEVNYLKLIK
ncbi:MAG: pseudouridine synthase [Bacteroidales bacterium]